MNKHFLLLVITSLFILNAAKGQNVFPDEGRVGIGTLTPQSTLNIKASEIGFDFISLVRNSGSPNLDFVSSFNGSDDLQSGSFAFGVRPSDDSWQIWSKTLASGWLNLFSVGINGKVGIGTTSPTAKLNVAGDLGTVVGSGQSAIKMTNTATGNYASISAGIVGVTNSGMDFSTDGTRRMVINEGGNVGIGTSSPTAKLNIAGDLGTVIGSGQSAIKMTNTATGNYASIGSGVVGVTNGGMDFSTDGVRRVVISETGNVGIGTASPEDKLSVAGIISSTSSSNEGGALHLINSLKTESTTANKWSLYNMTGSYGNSLQFWNYSRDLAMYGPRLTLADNGNIGIGTTTPKEKLSINGHVRAKEVKVEAENWPDYVFEPEYRLAGLQELEAYVKTHKRLPEMPSAKDVATNGIELGETNKLLLKKLEELTLHLIEKDKQLQSLAKRVIALETRQ